MLLKWKMVDNLKCGMELLIGIYLKPIKVTRVDCTFIFYFFNLGEKKLLIVYMSI